MAVDKDFKVKNGLVVVTTASLLSGVDSASTSTGALQVVGGAGIGKNLYVGSAVYIAGSTALTAANFTTFVNQTYIFAGTDTAVNTSSGNVTIWSTSTLQSITNRGATTNNAISITNATSSTTTATGALIITGGLGVGRTINALEHHTPTGLANRPSSNYDITGNLGHFQNAVNIGRVGGGSISFGDGNTPSIIQGFPGLGFIRAYINNDSTNNQLWYGNSTGLVVGNGTSPAAKLDVVGSVRISGITTITNTTAASSTQTGALQVSGGVGIGGNTYVGGNLNVSGEIVATKLTIELTTVTTTLVTTDDIIQTANTTNSTVTNLGALVVAGGAGIGKRLSVGEILKVFDTTSATSSLTGALQIVGGAGIQGSLFVGGNLNVGGTITGSISGSSNTATNLAGGVSGQLLYQVNVGQTGFVATGTDGTVLVSKGSSQPVYQNTLTLASSLASSSTQSGALQVIGGVGIGGDLFVSRVRITANTTASSTNSGDLVVTGGVGIGRDTFIGGALTVGGTSGGIITGLSGLTTTNAVISGTATAVSTQSGALQVVGGVGIGRDLYVGGNITIAGAIQGTLIADQIKTQSVSAAATYYPAFVDSNNATVSTETVYTTSTFNVNPASALVTVGNLSATNIATILSTQAASSTATGALQVRGGAGIGGELYIGNNLYLNKSIGNSIVLINSNSGGNLGSEVVFKNATTFSSLGDQGILGSLIIADSTDTSRGSIRFSKNGNGIDIGLWSSGFATTSTANLLIRPTQSQFTTELLITSTSSSVSTQTGALQVVGGVGIGGKLFARGLVNSTGTQIVYYNSSTGELSFGANFASGGGGITSPYAGIFTITNTSNATSIASGALQVAGGVAIGQDIYHNGSAYLSQNVFGDVVRFGSGINAILFNNSNPPSIRPGGAVPFNLYTSNQNGGLTVLSTGEVLLNSASAASSTSTGALRVNGGAGIHGNIYASGRIYSGGFEVSTATGAGVSEALVIAYSVVL